MVVKLEWFFLTMLSSLRIPGVSLHFLYGVGSRLPAKPHLALVQHHGNDPNTFVHVVVGTHMPDAAFGHLGSEGRCGRIDDYLGIALRSDEVGQIVSIFSIGLLSHLLG